MSCATRRATSTFLEITKPSLWFYFRKIQTFGSKMGICGKCKHKSLNNWPIFVHGLPIHEYFHMNYSNVSHHMTSSEEMWTISSEGVKSTIRLVGWCVKMFHHSVCLLALCDAIKLQSTFFFSFSCCCFTVVWTFWGQNDPNEEEEKDYGGRVLKNKTAF